MKNRFRQYTTDLREARKSFRATRREISLERERAKRELRVERRGTRDADQVEGGAR